MTPDPRDPLLACGVIDCPTCGERSYATDATWLDARHVLAVFASACPHVGVVGPLVVDVRLLDPTLRCQATTTAGLRCTRRATSGTGLCGVHQRQRAGRSGSES